jgi:N12 class adenine-specific DNA methylase
MDMPEEKSLDRYFISRSLDNLKPNGTMALITHSGILANKTNTDWRLSINRTAQFMGAIKLNDDSFNHTHTGIQPDILLFKKHLSDIQECLQTFSVAEMKESKFTQADWIDGTYFVNHPHHIMGTVELGKGQWGNDVVSGTVTPESLQAILGTFISEVPFSEHDYTEIRKSVALPKHIVKMSDLSLSHDEIESVEQKRLSIGSIKTIDDSVYILIDSYQWKLLVNDHSLAERLNKILSISLNITNIRKQMREKQNAATIQQTVVTSLAEYKNYYDDYPKNDTLILRFLRNHPSVKGVYDALLGLDSDILTVPNLYETTVVFINGHNRSVESLLFLQKQMLPATHEIIHQFFPDEAQELIAEMFRNQDIFLSEHSVWQLREDFINGNAWDKIDALNKQIETETDNAKKEKLKYGIHELEQAVGWISIEEADFSPHSSWVPENIINAWITDEDGLNRKEFLSNGKLTKNEVGKWGILYTNNHQIYDRNTRCYRKVFQGQWEELADEIVYYLNMQKQRSKYNDTETFNREHNERFKNYIANHKTYRDELETKYNRLFNTEIGVPIKTYPVYLEDWRSEIKTLKAHQWQSVHHLYREGKGISALGTGFGKTLTAIALHALLKQEDKINRAWFQVPNNKVKDWIKEIKEVLPHRTIGFIDPEMPGYSSREKRYAIYQELANSSYDIILFPESSAGEIQLSPEQDEIITNEVIYKHVGEKGENKSNRYVENLKESVARKLKNGKTNRTIYFEDFGCDAIFVDEAHRYKNLFTSTLSRETGLNDGRQSAKAMSLFKKTEYIRQTNNGKNVFLLTATPLTNSPLEYFNMLMYIAPEEIEKFGISTIDGFIKNFADIEVGTAYDWQNGTVTEKKILKGFKNIQTLQNIFFKYTDYQNDPQKINLEKPDAHNRPNVIPLNTEQTKVLQAISEELEKYKNADKDERRDLFPGQNYLTFYSQMRTASLDLELYDPSIYTDWKNPKLKILSHNAWQNYLTTKGGQVIFCDRILSSDTTFNIHDKIRQSLCNAGFKSNEIVIVNGITKSGSFKNDSLIEKEVSQAVAAFNNGVFKVIIGSTACIGEGLNLQENSSALHHFDIPFRPSDFIQRNGRIDRQGNAQNSVELHTYMSAGTIDNYSVSLVQRKSGWIDLLLKTKSNVFVNPNDENYIDADELLLALTEEWGDKTKADERRKEMNRVKEEKLIDAQHQQQKGQLSSLSLLRGSLSVYSGDKGKSSYQN